MITITESKMTTPTSPPCPSQAWKHQEVHPQVSPQPELIPASLCKDKQRQKHHPPQNAKHAGSRTRTTILPGELQNNRRTIRTFLICILNQIGVQKIRKWKPMTITSQTKKIEPWVKFSHSFNLKLCFHPTYHKDVNRDECGNNNHDFLFVIHYKCMKHILLKPTWFASYRFCSFHIFETTGYLLVAFIFAFVFIFALPVNFNPVALSTHANLMPIFSSQGKAGWKVESSIQLLLHKISFLSIASWLS